MYGPVRDRVRAIRRRGVVLGTDGGLDARLAVPRELRETPQGRWHRRMLALVGRNKIGLDVALEALRQHRRQKRGLDELRRLARVCRVEREAVACAEGRRRRGPQTS